MTSPARDVELLEGKAEARERSRTWRAEGRSIGLVPTMGALHDGHLSLVRAARERADRVVASVFVNPLQFAPGEDLDAYPRDLARDRELLRSAGCDALFTTTPDDMYPRGFSTHVANDALASRFEGRVRPTHFRGVLTVVMKLFQITQPDVAVFGQKDAQQALLIRRMVADLDVPVEVDVRPIVREPDGLAMSSRNAYLSPDDRVRATALSRGLSAARARAERGERAAGALIGAALAELRAVEAEVDYVALVDPDTWEDLPTLTGAGLMLVAARIGTTRLIDNAVITPG